MAAGKSAWPMVLGIGGAVASVSGRRRAAARESLPEGLEWFAACHIHRENAGERSGGTRGARARR